MVLFEKTGLVWNWFVPVYQEYAGIGFFVALCARKIPFFLSAFVLGIIKNQRLSKLAKKGRTHAP
jgi:hypothetical protein